MPFSQRAAELRHYKEKGVEKLYLHLDGWGQPGYDNKHPYYLPACKAPDGSILDVSRWAGGRQSYLCTTQAPYYVKRNFEEVLKHGIHLEASYLDVFTCNEGDECANPRHRMSRRECFNYRNACFDYLTSKGILPSSEEVTDWVMQSLVFCHYGS